MSFAAFLATNLHLYLIFFCPLQLFRLCQVARLFFPSKKWIKLIAKTIGNRRKDFAWGCAQGMNTTSENLQIAKHKSGRRSFRSPDWFVLYDLQIFSGGVYPRRATSRAMFFFLVPIVFGINLKYWGRVLHFSLTIANVCTLVFPLLNGVRCQKRCTLQTVRILRKIRTIKLRDRGSKQQNKRSNLQLHRRSSHWKNKSNYCKGRNFRRRKISYFSAQNLSYGI